MDHHCPWINNCIGFWNRKPFILLLVYVLLTSYFTAITMISPFYEFIIQEYDDFIAGEWIWSEFWDLFLLFVLVILDYSVAFLITMFLKFHIKLLLENKTTLENLEAKGKPF
jgi:hypothetical protein